MLNKNFTFYLVLLIVINCNLLLCQYQSVLISSSFYPSEVSIVINPKNNNQVVAGSCIYYVGADTSISGYYHSSNGGLNWSSGVLHSQLASPSGDPVLIVDTAGIFYYIQNANYHGFILPCFDRHLVMKSTNAGVNWVSASTYGYNGKFQDKPWGCVDWSNSVWRNTIYITWTEFSKYYYCGGGQLDSTIILFTKSTDGGLSWGQSVRLSKRKGGAYDDSNTMEGAVPCTGPNGEIYVSWSGPLVNDSIYAIFFNKSTDGGNTWLDSERVAAIQPGGWCFDIPNVSRCNGMPVTCCDISSGPYRGNVYINFSDQRNGIYDTDVWFIKSTNGGVSWSSVKRVNNDPPGKQQFFTWMTVDQSNGYIYFVFYDQRRLSMNYIDVYVARSTNGGETFQNSKLTSSPFFLWPNSPLSDYINISACNGHIRPIWTKADGNQGQSSIYTTIVDTFYHNVGVNGISQIIPDSYTLCQNYPNPFNPITNIKYQIARHGGSSTNVKLIVFDILGKEVSTLVNENQKAGEYLAVFNASGLASGIYFYKLEAGDFIEIKKMVLIK